MNDWAEDANGRLWLATSTEGIVAVDGSSYEVKHRIDKSTGLASNVIYSLKFDNNFMYYGPAHSGLIRYDHQNKGLQTFSPTHGLPTLEFNGGAASRLSNDHLAFGTINGTVLFNPADFNTSDKVTHSVQLTQLMFLTKILALSHHNVLLRHLISTSMTLALKYSFPILTLLTMTPRDLTLPFRVRAQWNTMVSTATKYSLTSFHRGAMSSIFQSIL